MFSSKDFDMSRILPTTVTMHKQLKGERGSPTSQERCEYPDGTFLEYEVKDNKVTDCKLKTKYTTTNTNIECMKGSTEVMKAMPLTYCGCPFKQAIGDLKTKPTKTIVTWTTKFSTPMEAEMMNEVRVRKINQINDFLKDLAGSKMAALAAYDFSKEYVHKKLMPTSGSMFRKIPTTSGSSECPVTGYTFTQG